MRRIDEWSWRVAVVLLAALAAASCISPPERQSYPLYPGPPLPTAGIAVLRLGDAKVARIDGLTAAQGDWTEVHLLPGRGGPRGKNRLPWLASPAPGNPTMRSIPPGIRHVVQALTPATGHAACAGCSSSSAAPRPPPAQVETTA